VCCSVLQCVAVCVAACCSVLQSVLQCVAVCCSVLQCVVACCSVLQCVSHTNKSWIDTRHTRLRPTTPSCLVAGSHLHLHLYVCVRESLCVAVCYIELQCVTVCYGAL